MIGNAHLDSICGRLNLSPFQTYILHENRYKYNLARLIKRGGVLFAPYNEAGVRDKIGRILLGPRADLIGMDKMLVIGERRIKFYPMGCFSAHENGVRYYADAYGRRMHRELFVRTVRGTGR